MIWILISELMEFSGLWESEQRSCIEGTKYRIRLQITHTKHIALERRSHLRKSSERHVQTAQLSQRFGLPIRPTVNGQKKRKTHSIYGIIELRKPGQSTQFSHNAAEVMVYVRLDVETNRVVSHSSTGLGSASGHIQERNSSCLHLDRLELYAWWLFSYGVGIWGYNWPVCLCHMKRIAPLPMMLPS